MNFCNFKRKHHLPTECRSSDQSTPGLQVREAGLETLPRLSSVFDARLFHECAARLGSMHGVVRMAAARGLAQVAPRVLHL